MLHVQQFTSFFLKFKSNLLVQRAFLSNAAFAMEILDFILVYILYHYHATQVVEIFHILRLFMT